MGREILGSFEYQILAILIQKPGDAYGTTVRERIEDQTGRSVSVGALYTTLDRLEKKGLVSSQWGEATPERGGRRKRYYKIEAAGVEAAHRTESVFAGFATRGLLQAVEA
jgi:DNA-binding PadR family transcriptional regulator